MWGKNSKKMGWRWEKKGQWMLIASLILSETNFIINTALALQFRKVQYFPISLCLATTIYTIIAFITFLSSKSSKQGENLQILQKGILPLTAFLVILASNQNNSSVTGICWICFVLQVLILGVKIVYFNVVINNASRISIVGKLARIGKICLVVILSVIGLSRVYTAVLLMAFQMIVVLLFAVRFTFQKIRDQYILMLGMVAGMISAVELLVGGIAGVSYIYIGEVLIVLIYLIPLKTLRALIELKYLFVISSLTIQSSAMDYYISLLFISECVFKDNKSFNLTQMTINKGLTCFLSMIQNPIILNSKANQANISRKNIIKELSIKDKEYLKKIYIEVMMDKLKSQSNFVIASFILRNCFEYDQKHSRKALVLFHRLQQAEKSKTSFLQQIKFQCLSQSIKTAFQNPQNSCNTVNFIKLNQALSDLSQQLNQCLKHQVKLIDVISQNSNNPSTKIQAMLLKRCELKRDIQQKIEMCFRNDKYFSSNQFKFMYVVYHTVISKKYLELKQEINSKFLSPQSMNLQYANQIGNDIIVSGFSCGEIINSNESFKHNFGLVSNSFNRFNIIEFIPFQSIKKKHRAAMMDQIDNLTVGRNNHSDYQCYLCYDEAEFGYKIKRIDKFIVSTRIFHEERQGFHFVCSIKSVFENEKNKMMVNSKDYTKLQSKNAPIIHVKQIKITQIDEQFVLFEIQLSLPSLQDKYSKKALQSATIKQSTISDLAPSNKLTAIQAKIVGLKGQKLSPSKYNALQLVIVVIIMVSLGVLIYRVHVSTSMLVDFVSKEQVIIQQAELLRSRLLLEEELLSLIMKTQLFPRNICSTLGIADMQQYLMDKFHNDLYNNSDEFMSLLVSPNLYGDLNKFLYTRRFSSQPFVTYSAQLISFQKQMRLLKAHLSGWYTNRETHPFDKQYYSKVVPAMLNNLGRESPGSTSGFLEGDQLDFSKDLQQHIYIYRVFASIGLTCAFIVLMFLRMKDYNKILDYLKVASSLQSPIIDERISQLRGSIDSLHKSRNNAIKKVNFTSGETIEIGQPYKRNILQVELSNMSKILRKQDEIHIKKISERQKYEKIIFQEQSNRFWILSSTKLEILKLFVIVCVLILLVNILFSTESSRITSIKMCNDAKEQLQLLQQKFINVVAYNWLKYFSFFQEIDLSTLTQLYNNAINKLKRNQYRSMIMQAYTLQLSNYILHGNVCEISSNQSQCLRYRSGIFEEGLSMLLPFVLKQEYQNEALTEAEAQMYALNICDKTWLLFEAVVPFTIDIPNLGFSTMIQFQKENLETIYVSTLLFMILLLVVVCWFIYRRCESEKSIRKQVLSLDEIKKLYGLPDFRPFLNEIYYQ